MNTPGSNPELFHKRVLIVTINRNCPVVAPIANGMTIVSDLTGAGYPFDVINYDRFIEMPFDHGDHHDIVFLNGHASPVNALRIGRKCQEAISSGRKIFVNGHLPYIQYDKNGKQTDRLVFSETLFNLNCRHAWTSGRAVVPNAVEKDPEITRKGHLLRQANTFVFKSSPEAKITIGRHIVGFLTPNGGAIDGSSDYLLNLLDYGKVTGYLRYGHPRIVGFANDRINGRPIVSIEVHCDLSKNTTAIDDLENMANEFQIPFSNLLVFARNTEASIKRWNEAGKNPLMLIGSHSRTHPKYWPQVADFYNETTGALIDQRKSIPMTSHYFNFSGRMNPTGAQIDELFKSGTIFGADGREPRLLGLPFDRPQQYYKNKPVRRFIRKVLISLFPPVEIQIMPTSEKWYLALSRSEKTPFCLSHTLWGDFRAIKTNSNYTTETRKSFFKNLKYGMYSFGVIHDYSIDRWDNNVETNGVLLKDQIKDAISFFTSQKVAFISTEALIRRLRDFISGWIAYTTVPGGGLRITVNRKSSFANQVKIEQRDQRAPVASGESVIGQNFCGNFLYVELRPEETSTFDVSFPP